MNIIFKIIRKPLVWRALLVLSVFSFNLLMGHNKSTIAFWSFFSLVGAICVGQPYVRRTDFLEDEAKEREMLYGSRNIYSFSVRRRLLGY